MKDTQLRFLTDIIYRSLFNKDTIMLLIQFNLSPLCLGDEDDDDLRDNLGQLALEALSAVEGACYSYLSQYSIGNLAWDAVVELVRFKSNDMANEFKALAAGAGVDLLTGERLEQK